MIQFLWDKQVIRTAEDARNMLQDYQNSTVIACALDTETTGLHIALDKPFVVPFGWIDADLLHGHAYAVDLEATPKLAREVIQSWLWIAKRSPVLLGHNIKFDLHMLHNIGFDYRKENLSDTMFYIRYGHDAVAEKNGGPPLALKRYASQYISADARTHESLLDQEKTALASHYNASLKQFTGMKKKELDEFFKDPINDPEDLPLPQRIGYFHWRESLPDWLQERFHIELKSEHIPYNQLNRENLLTYALYDIVWTLEIYWALKPIVEARENMKAIEIENSLILPLLDMERVGFCADKEYLESARQALKSYIKERRQILYDLAGETIKTGQHARIKELLDQRFGIQCTSTNSDVLSRIEKERLHSDPQDPGGRFISVIQELRTLEKWYSTYILRFQRNLAHTDRLYTTIQQVGTVSGRVTSDFQQFPKNSIRTVDGTELFNPRSIVKVSGGEYDALVYLDYSQIELRLQAMYTILVGTPEPNLCGAYMPYGCINDNGEVFDAANPEHIRTWNQSWHDPKTQKAWTPIDLHGVTTCLAFDITPDHPDFKKLRSKGKTLNFAKNYGASRKRVREMFPEYSEDRITIIDEAYYKAFPGVKGYHDYCYRIANAQAFALNLFGVRYYNVSGHNLINMLVQGSGAFFLKWKIRQLWEYSCAHHIKSRMQMNIHDEISWEKHVDENEVFFEFKRIMETWDDTLVPIVADMEVSRTTWSKKTDVDSVEDLRGERQHEIFHPGVPNAGGARVPDEAEQDDGTFLAEDSAETG